MGAWIGLKVHADGVLPYDADDPLHVTLLYFPRSLYRTQEDGFGIDLLAFSHMLRGAWADPDFATLPVSHWDMFGPQHNIPAAVIDSDVFASRFDIGKLRGLFAEYEPSTKYEFVPHVSVSVGVNAKTYRMNVRAFQIQSIFFKNDGRLVLERHFS